MIGVSSFGSTISQRILSTKPRFLNETAGDRVKVLGEAYSPDDDEDMAFATVSSVWIPRGRSRTEVMMARAGNWVLLGGVDSDIIKTATIIGAGSSNYGGDDGEGEIHIFSPLKFPQVSFSVCVFSRT